MDVDLVTKLVFVLYLVTIYQSDHGVFSDSINNAHNNVIDDTNETKESQVDITPLPDQMDIYSLNSGECILRRSCDVNREILGRTCQCDKLCQIFNDCCDDGANTKIMSSESLPKMHQFSCYTLTLRSYENVYMNAVTKCSSEWNDITIKDLCEKGTADSNVALEVPVSDNNNITYRNMYCAYCNFKFDFQFWIAEQKCVEEKNHIHSCRLFYEHPRNVSITKSCREFDYISKCSLTSLGIKNNTEQIKKCEEMPTNFVYRSTANGYAVTKYKNKYCALCNGEVEELLRCDSGNSDDFNGKSAGDYHNLIYSFRVLVDLNTLGKENTIKSSCKSYQMYDPLSKSCRRIFCPKTTIYVNGRCAPELRGFESEVSLNKSSCAFVKLKSNEWKSENETSIYVSALDRIFNSSMFYLNGTDLYICADLFENQIVSTELLIFNSGESYLSLCGLIISVSALTITLIIYCTFKELLNIPGKVLACLMGSLILAQISFLLTSRAANNYVTCKFLAIIVHYFYIASFTWMNIVASDLLITFSRSFKVTKSSKKSKRFFLYSVYGWLVPLFIVCVAIGMDESSILSDFKPGYGKGVCWITSNKALILFFIGPLAFFKLIDITGFIFTSCFIARARQQGTRESRTKKLCSFLLYIKLSAVMGLTWVFAFLATFTNNTVLWYMFIVFNTLQGVFIAASFLCTRKVFNLVRNRFYKKQNVSSAKTLLSSRK